MQVTICWSCPSLSHAVVMAAAAQTPLRSDSLILDRAFITTLLSSGSSCPPQTRAGASFPAVVFVTILPTMFMVSEEDATAIRTTFEKEGELSAAIELRRRFPGIIDNARARECARPIAGWQPLPELPAKVVRLRPRKV